MVQLGSTKLIFQHFHNVTRFFFVCVSTSFLECTYRISECKLCLSFVIVSAYDLFDCEWMRIKRAVINIGIKKKDSVQSPNFALGHL